MRLRTLVGVAFAVGGAIACSAPSLTERTVEGGRLVRTLGANDSTLAVFIEPSQCFACGGAMEPWVRLQARRSANVFIVLTLPPSPEQRRELAVRRIHAAGILDARRWWRERRKPPYVVLFVAGTTVFEQSLDSTVAVNKLLQDLKW